MPIWCLATYMANIKLKNNSMRTKKKTVTKHNYDMLHLYMYKDHGNKTKKKEQENNSSKNLFLLSFLQN